jgi:transmembrane sensor
MKYTHNKVQEFLGDPAFVKWIITPNKDLDEQWDTWLSENTDKQVALLEAREIVLSMEFNDGSYQIADPQLWHKIEESIKTENKQSTTLGNFRYIYRIAAAVVIAFLLSLLYYQNNQTSTETQIVSRDIITKENPNGVKTQIRLPDGTMVWLNSDSKLTYPSLFSDDSRNVELKGEAFFDVTENKAKPFVIQTPYFTTTVLGTSFSIRAYENYDPKVSLVEGKVKVSKLGSVQILKPNQQVVLKNGEMVVSSFDYIEEIGWRDGILFFNDQDISGVFDKIEKWYGVTVDFDQNKVPKSKYSGHHKNQSLEIVLKGLSYSLNFDYEVQGENIKILFN